jgi:hypothetical protein
MRPVPRPGRPSASTRVCGSVIRVLRQAAAHTAPVDRCRGALRRAGARTLFMICLANSRIAILAVQVMFFKFHEQVLRVQFQDQPPDFPVDRERQLKEPDPAGLQSPDPTALAAVRALVLMNEPGIFLDPLFFLSEAPFRQLTRGFGLLICFRSDPKRRPLAAFFIAMDFGKKISPGRLLMEVSKLFEPSGQPDRILTSHRSDPEVCLSWRSA